MLTASSDSSSLFKRRLFDSSIIILCLRWYITYKLTYRDLRDMMAERGVDLALTTILRGVQRCVPEFEKNWYRYAHPLGSSWRVDETYIKVRGEWKYLYRAVDYQGNTVGFLLSEHRDIAAAKHFFKKAIESHGTPEKITLDGYAASHTAVDELKESAILPMNVCVRTSKYLNNMIEEDHRGVKQGVYPMLGFKRLGNAAIAHSGIELGDKIKKGQYDRSELRQEEFRVEELWQAVLTA
jgi:transposase-like protein